MTAQISDIVVWQGEEYGLCGANGEGLFDPTSVGLNPVGMCTACWRGYVCHYRVADERLLLGTLAVSHGDAESGEMVPGPAVHGIEPVEGEGWMDFFNCVYEGLDLPVAYTGGLLLGSGFIEELYVHMGFHPAWKFEKATELIFADGRIEEARDLTARMAEVREKLADGPLQPGSETGPDELRKWIESTFNLYYENP